MMDDIAVFLQHELSAFFRCSIQCRALDEDDILCSLYDGKQVILTLRATVAHHIRMSISIDIPSQSSQIFQILQDRSNNKKKFRTHVLYACAQKMLITLSVNGVTLNNQSLDEEWPCPITSFHLSLSKRPCYDINSQDFINEKDSIFLYWVRFSLELIFTLYPWFPHQRLQENLEQGHEEGSPFDIILTRYERNPANREACLKHYGYTCSICGFNFEKTYGELGRDFIHVHHITPISQLGKHYCIDPEKDLIPVCPNCHAMLHKRNPPFTPEELRSILSQQKQGSTVDTQTSCEDIESSSSDNNA